MQYNAVFAVGHYNQALDLAEEINEEDFVIAKLQYSLGIALKNDGEIQGADSSRLAFVYFFINEISLYEWLFPPNHWSLAFFKKLTEIPQNWWLKKYVKSKWVKLNLVAIINECKQMRAWNCLKIVLMGK